MLYDCSANAGDLFGWFLSVSQKDKKDGAMKKISIFVLAVLLLTATLINATVSDKTGEMMEALPTDVTGAWSAINNGLTNKNVYTLAIDPLIPSTLYAGTQGGVFKSADWGGSWSAINSGLTPCPHKSISWRGLRPLRALLRSLL